MNSGTHSNTKTHNSLLLGGTIIVALSLLGGLGYTFYQYKVTTETLVQTRIEFASTTANLEHQIAILKTNLDDKMVQVVGLGNTLANEQQKNQLYSQQIQNLSTAVTTLDKLSKTDRELLKKYSKVYFLNENYVPEQLSTIDAKYLINKDKPQQFHAKAASYLQRLLDDAAAQSGTTTLKVLSAYRSFDSQGTLKTSYKVVYGSGANQFSAEQGYSEHQLGTAVDFNAPALATNLTTAFEKTAGYTWLKNNAYKYGFIMSYPKTNTYYQYEPWHWRFVGVALATKLHNENKNFYDLDQREIDMFLLNIFD